MDIFSGRWTDHPDYPGMSKKVWAFYDNPIQDTKDLAKNVPTVEERPDHWLNQMFPDGTWTTQYDSSIPPPYKSNKFIKGESQIPAVFNQQR